MRAGSVFSRAQKTRPQFGGGRGKCLTGSPLHGDNALCRDVRYAGFEEFRLEFRGQYAQWCEDPRNYIYCPQNCPQNCPQSDQSAGCVAMSWLSFFRLNAEKVRRLGQKGNLRGLAKVLDRDDDALRKEVMAALRWIASTDALPLLAKGLKDGCPEVRHCAAETLLYVLKEESSSEKMATVASDPIASMLDVLCDPLFPRTPSVVGALFDILNRLPESAILTLGTSLLGLLRLLLHGPSLYTPGWPFSVLNRLPQPVVTALGASLVSFLDEQVHDASVPWYERRDACKTLGLIGLPEARSVLLAIVEDFQQDWPNGELFDAACEELVKLRESRACTPLLRYLSGESAGRSVAAGIGIGERSCGRNANRRLMVANWLNGLGCTPVTVDQRIALAIAEGRFGDAASEGIIAIDYLVARTDCICEHPSHTVRQHFFLNGAGKALVSMGRLATRSLIELLTRGRAEEKRAAALALGEIRHPDAVEALIKALTDDSQGLLEYDSDWYHPECSGEVKGACVAQAASLALQNILENSAAAIPEAELREIADLPLLLEYREETLDHGCDSFTVVVHGVRNALTRQLARQELSRRKMTV